MIKIIFYFFLTFAYGIEIDIPKPSNQSGQNNPYIENIAKNKEYFIIMNIASNTLRVYSKGSCNDCFNTLELETEMVSGANRAGYRSVLGNFKALEWEKFYRDAKKRNPSWFDISYNDMPKPNADVRDWFIKRGAFGWMNLKLKGGSKGSAKLQWLHGSRGWGSDKKKFIKKSSFDGGSISWTTSGCSRVDNETISFLHSIIKKGSSVVKIYAKEDILEKSRLKYKKNKNKWSYILTADEVRIKDPHTLERNYVLRNIPSKYYLEKGTYEYSAYPTIKKNKNIYKVKVNDFNGVFYVDTGKLLNYKHPKSLKYSGIKKLPQWIIIE